MVLMRFRQYVDKQPKNACLPIKIGNMAKCAVF